MEKDGLLIQDKNIPANPEVQKYARLVCTTIKENFKHVFDNKEEEWAKQTLIGLNKIMNIFVTQHDTPEVLPGEKLGDGPLTMEDINKHVESPFLSQIMAETYEMQNSDGANLGQNNKMIIDETGLINESPDDGVQASKNMETNNTKRRRMETSSFSMPEEVIPAILSHFNVKTLIEKKLVCRNWSQICTEAIDMKKTKAFTTTEELLEAVSYYCGYRNFFNKECKFEEYFTAEEKEKFEATRKWKFVDYHGPDQAEEFATTYGYPINKWDVSNVEDFSNLFDSQGRFNEDISSWDVSRGRTMESMFTECYSFNQNISNWNVSNVRNMKCMFENCRSFNQNLSRWNVSNVVNMRCMFLWCYSFKQDVDCWDSWDSSRF